jgi:translation elongation factor EF-4
VDVFDEPRRILYLRKLTQSFFAGLRRRGFYSVHEEMLNERLREFDNDIIATLPIVEAKFIPDSVTFPDHAVLKEHGISSQQPLDSLQRQLIYLANRYESLLLQMIEQSRQITMISSIYGVLLSLRRLATDPEVQKTLLALHRKGEKSE